MKTLILKALANLGKRLVTVVLLLFLPAGSWRFWEAWAFLIVLFIPELLTAGYLMRKDPDLLSRRLKGGPRAENRTLQKLAIWLVNLSISLLLVVTGIDHRFHWSHVPTWLVLGADVAVLLGSYIQFRAFKENTFAAVVVGVFPHQKVISTGPYAIVRHPMYFGALVVNFFMPIGLGSWWGLPLAFVWLAAIIVRLFDEEKLLRQELPGYEEYRRKVQYRLIPHFL